MSLPTRPDPGEVPQRGGQRLVVARADGGGELAEEVGAAAREGVEHGLVVGGELELAVVGQGQGGGVGEVQRDPAVGAREPAVAGPEHLAGGGELVEHRRLVVGDPRRAAPGTPARRRVRRTRRAARRRVTTPSSPRSPRPPRSSRSEHVLPRRQEPGQRHGLDRLDLVAQPGERAAAQRAQHLGVAPLGARRPDGRNSPSSTRPCAPSRARVCWHDRDAEARAAAATSAARNGPWVRA